MKFTQERSGANVVQSFEPGAIRVKDRVITGHVILSAEVIIEPWLVEQSDNITAADMAPAVALQPEVLILGTGRTLDFPSPALLDELTSRGIGIEVMDTAAACRTFNVLVHEDRAVAAALLNENPD
jgi:uncharacterized protein